MTTAREFFPRSSRMLVGIALLIVAGGLSFAYWHYRVREPLETLAWYDQHRSAGDSLAYASALYHTAHARAARATRWNLTGYATLGTIGSIAGITLILSTLRRRVSS